mmetsp:Transcript_43693/g.114837  ORF Transcript_43693/g.114837 Transcript_43693/m.114837 type:complete len:220 (+) Transcript_43693:280-939(+)
MLGYLVGAGLGHGGNDCALVAIRVRAELGEGGRVAQRTGRPPTALGDVGLVRGVVAGHVDALRAHTGGDAAGDGDRNLLKTLLGGDAVLDTGDELETGLLGVVLHEARVRRRKLRVRGRQRREVARARSLLDKGGPAEQLVSPTLKVGDRLSLEAGVTILHDVGLVGEDLHRFELLRERLARRDRGVRVLHPADRVEIAKARLDRHAVDLVIWRTVGSP